MMSMNLPINLVTNASFIEYWGTKSYKTQTWIQLMAETFKAADVERAALAQEGPWTARTDSIRGYARINIYA